MPKRNARYPLAKRNSLDLTLLEPGDIILCANSHDVPLLRALLFWSHAGMYTGFSDEAKAFIDAVDLPVRRRSERTLLWQRVRFTSARMYQSYEDILVLRPDCAMEKRQAAAVFAAAQAGKPFPRRFWHSFFRRGDRDAYTCTSLVYHAYLEQGVDLSPRLFLHRVIPWPSALARHPRLRAVARGTRRLPLTPSMRNLWPIARIFWFRHILGADIIVRLVAKAVQNEPYTSF